MVTVQDDKVFQDYYSNTDCTIKHPSIPEEDETDDQEAANQGSVDKRLSRGLWTLAYGANETNVIIYQ